MKVYWAKQLGSRESLEIPFCRRDRGRQAITVLITILVLSNLCLAQDGVAGPIAYLANGELNVSCKNSDVKVTNTQLIENFAIAGGTLAIVRRMDDDTGRLFVIDLNSRRILSAKRTVGAATVRNTCGALMLEHFPQPNGDISEAVTMDIDTGRTFEGSIKNVGLSCSRDRNVIAYLMLDKQSNVSLVLRDVLTHTSATIAKHADAVSVSPHGQVVGYRDGAKICRWKRFDHTTECVDSDAAGTWIEALDDGQIWFGAAGTENCVYRLPNMNPMVDFCFDLYSWHTKEVPILLRRKTEMLQFLEPDSARLLCEQGFSPIVIAAESGMPPKKE
ncbi:MAG TPA: hypothetical protein VK716_15455 [Terracidiphilus sp.]|jgi:hypothetical protein|nr:hypothetical protein [Terracidiphilus sp.]